MGFCKYYGMLYIHGSIGESVKDFLSVSLSLPHFLFIP